MINTRPDCQHDENGLQGLEYTEMRSVFAFNYLQNWR